MNGKQRRFALTAGALLLTLLTGCHKETSPTGMPAPAGGGQAAGGNTPDKRIRIVFIPKNTNNPYFDAISAGFQKAADEQHFDFVTVGPAAAAVDSQIPFIKQQVQQHVDAIAICPNSVDAVGPALKEAMAQGIKVITVNGDTTGHEDSRQAAVLPTDFTIVGRSQIELLSGLIGGKGDFAILSATTSAPDQNTWIAGMKETLKDPKYKDMKLLGVAYGNDDPVKSETEAQGLLTKYPSIRGIIAPTTVAIAAAAHVVDAQKAASKVQVTGLGMPNDMRKYIQNGTVQKFALWNPSDEGFIAACLLAGMVNGSIKPTTGGTFTAGSFGERKFGDKNVVIAGPPTVFDKSNIAQYNF